MSGVALQLLRPGTHGTPWSFNDGDIMTPLTGPGLLFSLSFFARAATIEYRRCEHLTCVCTPFLAFFSSIFFRGCRGGEPPGHGSNGDVGTRAREICAYAARELRETTRREQY
jgi:hypothetical protein